MTRANSVYVVVALVAENYSFNYFFIPNLSARQSFPDKIQSNDYLSLVSKALFRIHIIILSAGELPIILVSTYLVITYC